MERLLSQMPFIVISRENLLAANDMLDREQKGELLEMIIDTVLNDGNPQGENKCVNGVYNQFMSVIERKAASYFGRKEHMDEVNEQKKKNKEQEPQVSTYTEVPQEPDPATVFRTIDDICVYLNSEKKKGQYYFDREINKICRDYNLVFESVLSRYNEMYG